MAEEDQDWAATWRLAGNPGKCFDKPLDDTLEAGRMGRAKTALQTNSLYKILAR